MPLNREGRCNKIKENVNKCRIVRILLFTDLTYLV